MEKKLIDYLEEEDLPYELRAITLICGLETIKTLMEVIPSTHLYIPNPKNINHVVAKFVRDNQKKYSLRTLAVKAGISETTARKALKQCAK